MGREFWFIVVLILINLVCLSSAGITGGVQGDSPTSRVVTTYLEDPNAPIFEKSERIWEISQSSIDLGQTLDVKRGDAIKMIIRGESYYLYVEEVASDELGLLTLGNQTIILKKNDSKIFEIVDKYTNERKILDLMLDSIEGEIAKLRVKTYDEKAAVKADYKELFDIEVDLPVKEIYSTDDLTVYIKFFNFGEGPSHIEIEYAILDDGGKEYYRGIDDKVVYTEDSLIKNFNFLKLEHGNYTATSRIFYGKNQTAYSEKNFRVLPVSQFAKFKPVIILGLIVIALIVMLYFMKFREKKDYDEKARTLKAIIALA